MEAYRLGLVCACGEGGVQCCLSSSLKVRKGGTRN